MQTEKGTEQSEMTARVTGKLLSNRKKVLSNRKKVLSNRKKVLSNRKNYSAIGNDCQSNRKKAQSNRKRLRANGNDFQSNRKMALSNQKQLSMQSGTTGRANVYEFRIVRVFDGSRMHLTTAGHTGREF